jgi:hypothetical protein
MSVIEIGVKTLYTSAGIEASEWVRKSVRTAEKVDVPYLKSGLSISDEGNGSFAKGALLGFTSNANSLMDSATLVYLTSSASSHCAGFSVMEGEGWRRAIALYSARKLSKDTWVVHKDEYLVPSVYEGRVG